MKNKNTKHNILFLIILWSFMAIILPSPLYGQLLEPHQPEQDACNAIEICGHTFESTYSYQGIGKTNDLSNTPCGDGENNVVWLKITIRTPGRFVFIIRPIDIQDDYDFAVVKNKGNCGAITSGSVIRCNFNNNLAGSNLNGIIGLSTSSNEPFVQGGVTGHSYCQSIDALTDDVYYIMVNNFGYNGGPSSGFTIDFSGSTATFANTTTPQLENLVAACDYTSSVNIHLSNYALCSSIASDASDFIVTNIDGSTSYTLLSASGINCSGEGGYARDVHLEFQQVLPNGNFVIRTKKGTDGNSILGLCGGETPEESKTISFSIKADSLKLVSIDSPACQKIRLIFNQTINCKTIKSDGSQFWITGPSTLHILSAQPLSSCSNGTTTGILITLNKPIDVDGKYFLHSKDDRSLYGACNSILYADIDQTFNVNSFNGLLHTIHDTTVCAIGDYIQITTTNIAPFPTGGFQYQWTNKGLVLSNTQLSPLVTIDEPTNYFMIKSMDSNGCLLRDTVNINLETFTGSVMPIEASICINDSLLFNASDNAVSYQWFEDSTLKNKATSLSANDIANPTYHPNAIGDFDYYLIMQSGKQCLDTLSVHMEVKPIPNLQLAFRDTIIDLGKNIQLLASGAEYYRWTPSISLYRTYIANPVAHPIVNTTYYVVGKNNLGCYTSDTVQVRIFFEDYAYFPTAFTPNNDGKNDVFRAHFFGQINQYSLNIYNRWGQKIYSSNNPSQGWKGTNGNILSPSGTYIWECIYQPDGQKLYNKKGTVVLIR